MPRIRYSVAMSLDGYIAGPKGEADWIIMDPDIDFAGLFAQFDTFLLGRRTFEAMAAAKGPGLSGAQTFVFSRTLRPRDHPGVSIVAEVSPATVAPIRAQARKDIWLFGGGSLFRSFLEAFLSFPRQLTGHSSSSPASASTRQALYPWSTPSHSHCEATERREWIPSFAKIFST